MVADQGRGAVGERLARLEALFPQILEKQDSIIEKVDILSSDKQQREAYATLGRYVFDITKLVVAAAGGALATFIFGRGH